MVKTFVSLLSGHPSYKLLLVSVTKPELSKINTDHRVLQQVRPQYESSLPLKPHILGW
jgi:hypothetical protein